MSWRMRILLVSFIILSSIGCDQITKEYARSHLPKNKVISFAGDTVRLDYNENKGAVFSFEYALPKEWRGDPVTAGSAGFLGLLLLCLLFVRPLRPFTTVALALFCGGALSNLLDRVVLGGNVVDFLNVGWGGYRTCIFNVADVAIVTGLALFVLSLLWRPRPASSSHSGRLELPPY